MEVSPGDILTRNCSSSQTLVIAAPYIKADALRRVLASTNAEALLICVTRWIPHDLAVGASDVECRELVVAFGGSFRLHPSLHAKFYRLDDVVLIGSANLTLSALGWSDGPNLEILCQAGGDFDFRAFEQALLDESREVTDAEFMRWQAISRIKSNLGRLLTEGQQRLSAWRPRTRDPIHLELSYHGRDHEIASLDEQAAARLDLQALAVPPGLTDEEIRLWSTSCLLAAPFTNSVLRLSLAADAAASHQSLARSYGLSVTEARRSMETVQNWLALLAPETLSES